MAEDFPSRMPLRRLTIGWPLVLLLKLYTLALRPLIGRGNLWLIVLLVQSYFCKEG